MTAILRTPLGRPVITGLRGRMYLSLILVCLTSTALVSGFGYVLVRRAVLQRAQNTMVAEIRETLTAVVPVTLTAPVPQQTMQEVADALRRPNRFVVVTDGRAEADAELDGSHGFGLKHVPPRLAARAGNGNGLSFQRIVVRGYAWLVVGTRVLTPDERPTPLTVYVFSSLHEQQDDLNRIQTALLRAGGIAVALAVLVAALLGGSVLGPVRRLGRAARSLGDGDLSARVEVRGRDELADVARTFNESAASLEYTMGELRRMEANARRFAADVSHELRTPIAAMTAVSGILTEDAAALPSDTGTAARLVADQARRLNTLVEDLLEISRMDAGTTTLVLDEVPLATLVEECATTRGWTDKVIVEIPPDLRVRLDPRRFGMIIANLIANALIHGAPPVRVTARPGLEVSVMDHGPGIPDEVLPHVFDRFFKADPSRPASHGSGLGLAIAHANALLHGGTIEAANSPDAGAVFTVCIPA